MITKIIMLSSTLAEQLPVENLYDLMRTMEELQDIVDSLRVISENTGFTICELLNLIFNLYNAGI